MTTAADTRTQAKRGPSAEDWTFCATMLPKVSRTFALSIGALPPELCDAIRVAYLLCRAVDTIEDDAVVAPDVRERLYDLFDLLMTDDGADPTVLEELTRDHALGAGTDDHTLCINVGAVFRCYRALPIEQIAAIRPHVLEMSRGMREFTRRADRMGRLRLTDLDELERYCYFVAGTVGKLLTALFEHHVGDLPQHLLTPIRARSVSFGLALQLVNIVKDVAEDLPRGDCFLPEELATGEGVRLDDILEPQNRDAGLAIIRRVCERARDHLKRAEQYTLLWPAEQGADVRMFCTVPLVLALATLREVEHGGDTLVAGKTPKISRQAVGEIFADARVAVQRNDTLRWMIGYYAGGAYLGAESMPAPAKERVSTLPPRDAVAAAVAQKLVAVRTPPPSVPPPSGKKTDDSATSSALSGKVLVTGAQSQLGANLVRGLLEEGCSVRVFIRRGDDSEALAGLTVERAYGDLRDRASIDAAVAGCDAIFHAAPRATPRDEERLTGTQNLLAAAKAQKVRRVVCSGSFPRTRADDLMEKACLRAFEGGLDVVVVSGAAIVGAHGYQPSPLSRSLLDHARGKLRTYVDGGLEIVAAHDLVVGHLLAMTRGRAGESYTLATAYLSSTELLDLFETVTGVERPRVRLSPRMAQAVANVSSLVASVIPAVRERVSPELSRVLSQERRADTRKAREELGFTPTSLGEAAREAYADLARRGLVSSRTVAVAAPPETVDRPKSAKVQAVSAA